MRIAKSPGSRCRAVGSGFAISYIFCVVLLGSTWRSLVLCLALELRKGNDLSWFGVTWPVKANLLCSILFRFLSLFLSKNH